MRRIAVVALGTVALFGVLAVPSHAQGVDGIDSSQVGDSLNGVLNTSNNSLIGQLAFNAPSTNFQLQALADRTAPLGNVLGRPE